MTIKSILPDELRGVTKTTGYRGIGKSYFISQIENPALTAFFDFEKKGEGINNKLHFGLYVPVTERASGGSLGIYDTFIHEIEKLPDGKFTHAIIDNTAPLEMAMRAEAARNAQKYAKQFGMVAANIVSGAFGGQSGVVNHLISEYICNPLWAKGVKLISVTAHIKNRWAGGAQVVNSFNIKGADRWDELSVLTLVLIPGKFSPVPAALVMKEQLGLIEWNDKLGEFNKPQRRLPYCLPQATPRAIREYLEHPADLENPQPGEVPTEDEIQPFREKLSREQIKIVLAEIENAKENEPIILPSQTFSVPSNDDEVLTPIEKLKRKRLAEQGKVSE